MAAAPVNTQFWENPAGDWRNRRRNALFLVLRNAQVPDGTAHLKDLPLCGVSASQGAGSTIVRGFARQIPLHPRKSHFALAVLREGGNNYGVGGFRQSIEHCGMKVVDNKCKPVWNSARIN
jgi:hypothetical protein